MKEYGSVKESNKHIDSIYICNHCGELLSVIDKKLIPQHKIQGWIIHESWSYLLKCLSCDMEKEP